jgi:hypothetical protein
MCISFESNQFPQILKMEKIYRKVKLGFVDILEVCITKLKKYFNVKKGHNDDKKREDLVFVDKTKLLLSTEDGYDALGSIESGKILKAISEFRFDLHYSRLKII